MGRHRLDLVQRCGLLWLGLLDGLLLLNGLLLLSGLLLLGLSLLSLLRLVESPCCRTGRRLLHSRYRHEIYGTSKVPSTFRIILCPRLDVGIGIRHPGGKDVGRSGLLLGLGRLCLLRLRLRLHLSGLRLDLRLLLGLLLLRLGVRLW